MSTKSRTTTTTRTWAKITVRKGCKIVTYIKQNKTKQNKTKQNKNQINNSVHMIHNKTEKNNIIHYRTNKYVVEEKIKCYHIKHSNLNIEHSLLVCHAQHSFNTYRTNQCSLFAFIIIICTGSNISVVHNNDN
jgi:hypothetical protein